MKPNYNKAAVNASETFSKFGSDPMKILQQFPNVLLISFESSDISVDQDAFTCVGCNDEHLKYIVFYNQNTSPVLLRSALARELGHVILEHDGSDPEEIWTEEANCFAYHFICPTQVASVEIKYRPERATISMSFKDMKTFNSVLFLKEYVAEERTRFMRAIGHRNICYTPNDVDILSMNEDDIFGHWKNYSTVLVAGKPVGFCGE